MRNKVFHNPGQCPPHFTRKRLLSKHANQPRIEPERNRHYNVSGDREKQKLKLTALPAPAEFLRTLIYQQYARRVSPALYPPGRKTWLFAGNFVRRHESFMPNTLSFHQVDVFANKPLEGNALAVVSDADDLTTEQTIYRQPRYGFRASRTNSGRTNWRAHLGWW